MTIQQAAGFLGISCLTLVRLLESGEIEFDKPGPYHRVKLDDLAKYQETSRAERRAALSELQRDTLRSNVQVGQLAGLKRLAEFEAE